MPYDLLVKLYGLSASIPIIEPLRGKGIDIRRALPIDKHLIVPYVRDAFSAPWASECDVAFSHHPPTCMIAVHEKEIVGFACYNTTCWGFFGPIGVTESFRRQGVGTALLLKCLLAMWDEGYAYAVVGWVDEWDLAFYQKAANATVIADSVPGIYKRMICS
jgi:GNAT superfamily N-acetyltransferase